MYFCSFILHNLNFLVWGNKASYSLWIYKLKSYQYFTNSLLIHVVTYYHLCLVKSGDNRGTLKARVYTCKEDNPDPGQPFSYICLWAIGLVLFLKGSIFFFSEHFFSFKSSPLINKREYIQKTSFLPCDLDFKTLSYINISQHIGLKLLK